MTTGAASTTCSKLSRTSSVRRPDKAAASVSSSAAPDCSPDPERPAIAWTLEIRAARRREVDEHGAVAVLVFDGACGFQREARLPDANGAGDREHPDAGALQELVELFELSRSPDDRSDRSGKPGRNVRQAGDCGRAPSVVQDVAFELLERSARLEPELVAQRPSRVAVDAKRVRLPALSIEREHELPTESLAQGLGLDQILELGDEAGLTSARKVCVDPRLERIEPSRSSRPTAARTSGPKSRSARGSLARARAPREGRRLALVTASLVFGLPCSTSCSNRRASTSSSSTSSR